MTNTASLPQQATDLHKDIQLHPNSFWEIDDLLLSYTIGLLRSETEIIAPHCSIEAWEVWLKQIKMHNISQQICYQIGLSNSSAQPPQTILQYLKKSYQSGTYNSLVTEKQAMDIASRFHQSKVDLIFMKGIAYAHTTYSRPELRLSGDIDVLVRPEQVFQARQILTDLGYVLKCPVFEKSGEIRCEETYSPTKGHKQKQIDLHWGISYKNITNLHDYHKRAITVKTPMGEFQTFKDLDATVHACIHAMVHHLKELRLGWVCDAAHLFRRIEAQNTWEELWDLSEQLDATQEVIHMMYIAHFWCNSPCSNLINKGLASPLKQNRLILKTIQSLLGTEPSLIKKGLRLWKIFLPDSRYILSQYPKQGSFRLIRSHTDRWKKWLQRLFL